MIVCLAAVLGAAGYQYLHSHLETLEHIAEDDPQLALDKSMRLLSLALIGLADGFLNALLTLPVTSITQPPISD